MRERERRVFALIDDLIGTLPVPSRHKDLLHVHIEVTRDQAEYSPEISAVQLPLLAHAAITGDERAALPVAAACTILHLGVDLFDSIVDHELPPPWHVRSPAEANLAATTFLSALPQLSLDHLQDQGTPPARLWTLAQLFASALLTMSAGQHEDLLFSNLENVPLEDCLAMVERKSGSEIALLARTGAVLATEDSPTIEAYAAFGSCLGIAKQLINDVWGIWGEDASRDLLEGKRTFPIVYALSTLEGEQREQLQRLLAVARESVEHHDEVRAMLEEAGSVRYTALIVWLHQQLAGNHLDVASPRDPAGRELRMLLDQASLVSRHEEARVSD